MWCEKVEAEIAPEVIAEKFVYPVVSLPGTENAISSDATPLSSNSPLDAVDEHSSISKRKIPIQEKLAWQRGFEEGRTQAVQEFEPSLAREREVLLAAVSSFAKQREGYFRDIEAEVVYLVLAIARRILNRETKTDPLALCGLVRVALEKIAAGGTPKLHLHPARIGVWQDYLSGDTGFPVVPELVSDPSLDSDGCILVTAAGTAEFGLEAQMKEIEQGFFDLLERRPRITE